MNDTTTYILLGISLILLVIRDHFRDKRLKVMEAHLVLLLTERQIAKMKAKGFMMSEDFIKPFMEDDSHE